MTIAREEIFGPVLAVLTFKTEEEALHIANDTQYGLQASLFTDDLATAHRMGIYHIDFYPYSGGEIPYDIDFKTAVTAGEPQLVPNSIETVIDLGVRSICPETMAEIAFQIGYASGSHFTHG